MEQIFKPAEVTTKTEDLREEFENIKAIKVEKAEEYTIVNMRLIVGCGCGGNSEAIHMVIPGNHPELHNDYTDRRVNTDELHYLQMDYPGSHFYKGKAPGGVTDHYNTNTHTQII